MPGVVLITGASSGIGLESSVHLARGGFQVIGTMRDPAKGRELQRAAAAAAVKVDVIPLDVTSEESVGSAVDDVIARYGRIDALVNNAGIQIRGYFEDLSDLEIRKVFETNVFGTMNVTRAVLPYMRKSGGGRIVIVTSVGGRIGSPGLSAYCSSKFAMEGFGETLALEAGLFGISVSLVEPGIINTEIWQSNKLVAEASKGSQSPYRAYFAESERMADWAVKSSPIRTSHVAKAIHHALTSVRPRRRYLVGYRPGILLMLRRLMPQEVFERIYASVIVGKISRARS
jgi:NAD(P)-dependent dehydrogenase (short-subunit alcohol dehydrogenase family)